MYRVTQAQWDAISEKCKRMSQNGGQSFRFFIERDDEGRPLGVPVRVGDNPRVEEVPAHYKDMWPLDPHD